MAAIFKSSDSLGGRCWSNVIMNFWLTTTFCFQRAAGPNFVKLATKSGVGPSSYSSFSCCGFTSGFNSLTTGLPSSAERLVPRVLTELPVWESSDRCGTLLACNNSRRKSSADSSAFRLAASEWNFLTWATILSFRENVLSQCKQGTLTLVPQHFLWRKKFLRFLILVPQIGQGRG